MTLARLCATTLAVLLFGFVFAPAIGAAFLEVMK
jgi:hypothetical protein